MELRRSSARSRLGAFPVIVLGHSHAWQPRHVVARPRVLALRLAALALLPLSLHPLLPLPLPCPDALLGSASPVLGLPCTRSLCRMTATPLRRSAASYCVWLLPRFAALAPGSSGAQPLLWCSAASLVLSVDRSHARLGPAIGISILDHSGDRSSPVLGRSGAGRSSALQLFICIIYFIVLVTMIILFNPSRGV